MSGDTLSKNYCCVDSKNNYIKIPAGLWAQTLNDTGKGYVFSLIEFKIKPISRLDNQRRMIQNGR